MNKIQVVPVCLGVLLFMVSGCGKSPDTTRVNDAGPLPDAVSIRLVDMSGCKEAPTGIARVSGPSNEGCVEWWYVGGSVLHLRHINAGFNCCPVVDVDICVENGTITVEEIEIEGNCHCLCLFDVDYEIQNLPAGVYALSFIEPYRPAGDPVLECALDLESSPSGRFCVTRSQYPWGM